MKRFISLLIATGIAAGALMFGETGYKGIEWEYTKNQAQNKINSIKNLNEAQNKYFGDCLIIQETAVLGKQNEIFYLFSGEIIDGITYIIPTTQSKELKDKMGKLVIKTKTDKQIEKQIIDELKKENAELNPEDYWRPVFASSILIQTHLYESVGYAAIESKNKKTSPVFIYDYNDDTRVYIYENIIEGQTVVVYVPHEQDY